MRIVAAVLLVGCGASAPAPVPLAPIAPEPAAPAPTTPESTAPKPVAAAAPVPLAYTGDTPTHKELAWLVDLLATRQGIATRDELAQHWDKSMLGAMPLHEVTEGLRAWGAEAAGAVVERIEIDDPTYLVAHVATPSHRWRVILSLDPSSAKIVLIKHTTEL